jgi:ADP-heptose:LPS heptosyltransferase
LTGLVNFAGQTSVGELAALLEESDLFIGNDSGPLHVAAALGKPTLSIFGPGFPEKWAPTGPQHRLLHHPSGCPCFPWHPAAKCERADRCIDAVTIEEVKQAATELLSRRTLIKEPLMNADGHG